MSLSSLLLAITLILWGATMYAWIALSPHVLGGLLIATGVLMILEMTVLTYRLPILHRTKTIA